jgi:hypothetical protein
MKIVIDVRETSVYDKCWLVNNSLQNSFCEIEKRQLPLGDILLESDEGRPIWIVERKSLSDLLASIQDGRYVEQSYRLQNDADHSRHNVVYIIEGLYSQLSNPKQKRVILSTIASLSYFKGFSVFRTNTTQETAELLVYMADKIDRKFQRGVLPYVYKWDAERTEMCGVSPFPQTPPPPPAQQQQQQTQPIGEPEDNPIGNPIDNPVEEYTGGAPSAPLLHMQSYSTVVKKVKKENITSTNIGEILLSQIPGISSTTAIAIMTKCNGSLKTLIELLSTDPVQIESLKIGCDPTKQRKIAKSVVVKLKEYLLQ